ncbi:MAG: LysR family transcriptional regulator [Myxococcales bacterium]|nr:LysR family transcriptional regulator [Myxococcales bacterium]MCB9548806.1 LysR family transcriptional regulator [Myxococcales bacterium]
MTLRQLEVLVKVVEAGSLTRAAGVLRMQRSNVSRALAELEAELGVVLLDRTTRRQSVTEAGREVYGRAVGILEAVAETHLLTQRLHDDPRGCLRLTCSVEYGMVVVGPLIEGYLARYPQTTVEVEYASRDIDIVHEGFDLAIRGGPLPDSSLVARKLGRFDYGLFASPAYVAARGAPETPEALGAHDVIHSSGQDVRPVWTLHHPQRAAPVRVEGQPRLRVNTGAAVRSAVLQGLGVAPLPTVMARAYVAQGQLQRLLAPWHPASVPVYAVYPQSRHLSPKVRAFVDLALSAFSAAESGEGGPR